MVDISNPLFTTTDASNSASSPNGYNSSTTPANVIAIEQAFRGAVKRLYERLGPVLTSTGSANAYVVTPSNATYPSVLTQGDIYSFISNFSNSGAATLAYNGLTATGIFKMGGSGPTALTGGEIQSGQVAIVAYDGSHFQLVSALPFPVVAGYAALTGASFTGAVNLAQGASIASASTTAIGAATGNYITVTGTTGITAFDTIQAGSERIVQFAGVLTLTYNATSLILPGAANITTAAGDVARFISLGSGNWICVNYSPANGVPIAPANTLATYLGFTTSAGVNGYIKFPGGIIMQWGVQSSVGGNSAATVTVPLTFPNNFWNVQITSNTNNGGAQSADDAEIISTSQFTLRNHNSGTASYTWTAIGN